MKAQVELKAVEFIDKHEFVLVLRSGLLRRVASYFGLRISNFFCHTRNSCGISLSLEISFILSRTLNPMVHLTLQVEQSLQAGRDKSIRSMVSLALARFR